MNWIEKSKLAFNTPRPTHFTDFKHCPECLGHDITLNRFSPDTITIKELGSIASDPMCFATVEAIRYYLPAMIRLSIETLDTVEYIDQLFFHLSYDGKNNKLRFEATKVQEEFIQDFLAWLFTEYTEHLDNHCILDAALSASEVWNK
jgi:hypothetical protein